MNIFGDDEYNHELKEPRLAIKWEGPDERTFADEHAAAEAMREVDDEIAARLRGDSPCL